MTNQPDRWTQCQRLAAKLKQDSLRPTAPQPFAQTTQAQAQSHEQAASSK